MNYFPILDSIRSDSVDSRYFGLAFLYDEKGKIFGKTSNAKFYLRSMMKQIQASIISEEIIKCFKFTNQELAVMQASHSGENIHTELVRSILSKIGLNKSSLLCPVIPPLNTKGIENYSKIHNNCSGKHSMMLAYCVYNGLDIKNYNDFNHPVQLKIKEKLLNYAETDDYLSTKDGCTVPVYGIKIENIAKMFFSYYKDLKNSHLIEAYSKNPYIIGGSDNFGKRTDTKIMELNKNLFSKVGAGGFIYVYNNEEKQILMVKMAQDNNPQREIVVLEILYQLGWLQERHYDKKIYTEDNYPIGEYVLNNWKN